MASSTIDIKCGRLFPFPFLVLGGAIVFGGVIILPQHPVVAIILLAAGISVLSASEGTEIDPAGKTFREYNAFLSMRIGNKQPYSAIEKIFINAGQVSRKIYTAHTLNSSTFRTVEYNAFLKLADGRKILLASDKNKERLLKRFSEVAMKLDTVLTDTTTQRSSA